MRGDVDNVKVGGDENVVAVVVAVDVVVVVVVDDYDFVNFVDVDALLKIKDISLTVNACF